VKELLGCDLTLLSVLQDITDLLLENDDGSLSPLARMRLGDCEELTKRLHNAIERAEKELGE
jgi:hypothetical protein